VPTTDKEAQQIGKILSGYLDQDEARALFEKLDDAVGKHTDNDSLRESLSMLRLLHLSSGPKGDVWRPLGLSALVTFHAAVIVVNITAFFVLPFMYPLWIWVPLNSFILTVTFTREQCPLTRLENRIRVGLGKKRIGGFMGHYFVKPTRRFFARFTEVSGSKS
jgi:hypothetical protein